MFGLNLWARPFLHAPPSAQGGGMDPASSYLPNPLSSPALMVLASSAAEQGRDVGQLSHGPLLSTGRPCDKEAMLNPFGAAAGAFPFMRPGAPHFPGLHNPLWRPQLDPATLGLLSARGAGAFHPLSKEHHEAYPSAFIPAKRPRLSDERSLSPGDAPDGSSIDGRGGSPYTSDRRPCSPAASRIGSQSDEHSEHGDRYTPDSSVKDLSKWTSPDGQGVCCPICQALLQPGEVQNHLAKELTELNIMLKDRVAENKANMKTSESNPFGMDLSGTREITSKSRYDTFLRIKGNREARLAKLRGRRRRYNEMAQQLMHSSSTSAILDSSTEKDNCEDEQIDVISCDENKEAIASTKSEPRKDALTCSECMEPYANSCPITSMQCWHVHCEKCWLKTMETKKLCPQCKVVTSPSDLRRIFI
ncbi:hypothetical protein CAPTEDRAFT_225133 [Capitella teleta]|uniref:RING-type domain-containing protein n=1 Tax=Capitella teleta TaxID=283909 RepID=R7TSF4_CAPTE|nr:hypothetical protein CAPTEDRAFT_225133 [Capitella teleta]|eukprot:ELT96803.1 hypothetical protein CAPTEDRAFT_225133 [Capitella teleta]